MRQMLEARDGTIWMATDGGGLYRTAADGRVIARYRHDPRDPVSLPGDRVVCLAEDADGSLWAGTDGAGLARLDPATGRFERFRKVPGDPGSLGGDTVWALLVDDGGTLWVGLEGAGLDRFERETRGFSHRQPAPGDTASLGGFSVRALLEDARGRLWVGLWDGGLTLWDRATDRAAGRFKPSDDPGSLADASVTCLFEDSSGSIWVGTGGSGIDRVVEEYGAVRFEHLGAAQGLAGSDIVGALEDGDGNVWIVSGTGLSRLDEADGSIRSWGPADGFQSRFSQSAWLALSDGRFLLGGPEGVDSFRPGDLTHPDAPPPVLIADVSVVAHPDSDQAGSSIRARAFRAALNSGTIILRPEDAALTLDFAVLDYVDPARNRLSVELWGGPAERMDLGSQDRAVLGGLAPGDYELRVSGATAGGVWNREGAVLRIVVKPPFWRTPAFAMALTALVMATAYVMFRTRTAALEKRAEELRTLTLHMQNAREEERKTAAREVHDELGQLLTAAKMDMSWLRSHPPAPDAFSERVGEAIAMVDSAIESVQAISTRLRPKALDTLSLSEALRWQLEDFRRRSKIECRASIDPAPEGIDEESATTMFRVFQEILTNVGRHAEARNVDVSFECADGEMTLRVRDDGRGLPERAADSPQSLGILGMRERVRHAGGSFELESPIDGSESGTRASVRIPLAARRAAGGKGERHA
jgi:signal transduction histidine kinase/streptogramin lyase